MFERRNYAEITVTLLVYKRVAACGAVMAVFGSKVRNEMNLKHLLRPT